MSRKQGKVPSYCHHKASGQAVVRINGRDHYIGRYGSDESHAQYERLICEWRSQKYLTSAKPGPSHSNGNQLTVVEIMLRYRDFAAVYYSRNGTPTKEFEEMKYALRVLRLLYGTIPANDIGPLKLKAIRQHMIDADLSRGVINQRINRIKRFFKWAVSEELIPSSVYEGLRTVVGLRYGRTEARETAPIMPANDEHVNLVIPHVSPQVAAMIQLQRYTGMRPCEVVSLRVCDIDQSGEVWIYEPLDHKNAWRGHRRQIPIGPKGREAIESFLDRAAELHLFSPAEAEAHRNATRRSHRKSPMTPSQAKRKPKKSPKRRKRESYDVASYRRAITYGIKRVNLTREQNGETPIPRWFPLQLRHSRATELNELFGIEAAAVSLGHAHADVTKVYAERNLKLAIEVAKKTG